MWSPDDHSSHHRWGPGLVYPFSSSDALASPVSSLCTEGSKWEIPDPPLCSVEQTAATERCLQKEADTSEAPWETEEAASSFQVMPSFFRFLTSLVIVGIVGNS